MRQQALQKKNTNEMTIKQLEMMGYDRKYILQAMEVHKQYTPGTNWNLSLLVEIILRIQTGEFQRMLRREFVPHYDSMNEPSLLQINDTVDYRFDNGRYILCKIIEKDSQQNIIKLRPVGLEANDTKHDQLCNINHGYTKLAPPRSVS